jgi:hypothetical protein
MPNVQITDLPAALPLDGTELVPIVQSGVTVRTTTGAVAGSPSQNQTFITASLETTLPNSRYLGVGDGLTISDQGPQDVFRISVTGELENLINASTGLLAKTGGTTIEARAIQTSGQGLSITNGSGVAGDPTIALDGLTSAIAGLSGYGQLTLLGTGATVRELAGTTGQIEIANPQGTAGNPTFSLAATGVSAGSYGNAASTIELTVDAQGRLTYVTALPIALSASQITTGALPVARGGTGAGNATDALTNLLPSQTGQNGKFLATNGTTTFWQAGGTVISVNGYTGVVTLNYADVGAPSTSGTNATGTWGISISGNAATATSATTATTATSSATAISIAGGLTNQILYQIGAGSTSFITAPSSPDVFLKWTGSVFTWGTIAGAGTVTSIDASGGTTGLTFTGGPVTSSGTLTLSGTLGVANGGSGATSLTGYVVGNGTSAFTASSTIPSTDITGLGSMSTQSASSVAITGGVIDGVTIGGTTPGAGTFSSVAMTTGTITTPPVSGNDIVNKTYADSIAAGINFHQACNYATTTALPASTYNNGVSGVGATITGNANGALTVDGYTFVSPADNGKRILVKNQANAAYNGVYTLTQAGNTSPGAPFILTRATDFNTTGSGVNQIDAGDFFLITSGTANANTSWVQQTPLPITIGTTGIVFSQFGAPITYSAGTGLNESPAYTFNIANTGVTAGSYGGAATAITLSVNAQGQITSATDVSIAIAGSQITSGTVGSSYISGSYTGITGVGTLTAGTWNATTISPGYGGTGLTSYSIGDLIYASGTTTISKLALGTTNYVLVAGAAAPEYVAQSTLSVGSAATATTATNATNVATTATATNADFYIPFVAAATTSNQALGVDAGITYNPSTNAITAGISGGTF